MYVSVDITTNYNISLFLYTKISSWISSYFRKRRQCPPPDHTPPVQLQHGYNRIDCSRFHCILGYPTKLYLTLQQKGTIDYRLYCNSLVLFPFPSFCKQHGHHSYQNHSRKLFPILLGKRPPLALHNHYFLRLVECL